MYWIADGVFFMAGIAAFVLSFTQKRPALIWVGPVWILTYPILLQMILNLISICRSKTIHAVAPRSRIVYHPDYNITFCGIQKCHPFDSKKYGNIFQKLQNRQLIRKEDVIMPDKPQRKFLLEKIGWFYLLKMCYTIPLCMYIEMPLFFMPNFILRWRVLDPMVRATEGSVIAACVAEQLGWAVNLSGGFHHANTKYGGGFCIYPDITMVVHYLRTRLGKRRIMIVDLDAHQGNGHERDHLDDTQTYIIDFYNHAIYPQDYQAARAIRRDQSITARMSDDDYLEKVRSIEKDIDHFSPQFIIYNAGTDILDGDPLGRLNLSPKGIIKRDEIMIEMCIRRKIPVVMILSGGYQMQNAQIIADSIQNMMKNFS